MTGYKWVIPFASYDGNNYEIHISKVNGDTFDSVLTGAPSPIVIEEDDEDYMFEPVRTQSGYVRIVDTGVTADQMDVPYDWRDLVPDSATQSVVELYSTDDDEVLWRGFMQPTVFASNYHGRPQVIELPICGILDVLDGTEFDPESDDTLTLAGVLSRLLIEGLGDVAWELSDIYFQGVNAIEADRDSSWLLYRVSAGLFKGSSEGSGTLRHTCLEVLQKLCQFFGFTCRTNGVNLYLVSPCSDMGTLGFTKVTLQDLNSIDSGGFPLIQTYSAAFIERSDFTFLNTENTDAYIAGVRRVKVSEDVDPIDGLVDIPFGKIQKMLLKDVGMMPGGEVMSTRYGGSRGLGCWYHVIMDYDDSVASSVVWGNMVAEFPVVTVPGGVWPAGHYAWAEMSDWDDGAYADVGGVVQLVKHNYNWMPMLRVRGTGTTASPSYVSGQPSVKLTGRDVVSLSDGVLVLNITTRQDRIIDNAHKVYNGAGVLYLSIGIGDKWWHPSNPYGAGSDGAGTWEDTEEVIAMSLAGGELAEGEGKLTTNRVLSGMLPNDTATQKSGPYPPYTGFGIPVVGGLTGKVRVRIYGVYSILGDSAGPDVAVDITELSVDFLRGDQYEGWSERDTNTYTRTTSAKCPDEVVIENIFTTDDNNAPGNGILIEPEGGYASVMEFEGSGGGGMRVPREELGDMVGSYYAKARHQLRLTIYDWHPGDMPRVIYTISGHRYYPISTAYDFVDDACTVKMMELEDVA